MGKSLAGPANFVPKAELERHPSDSRPSEYRETVKKHAAKLYGQGFKRIDIARIMVDHIPSQAMRDRPHEQKLRAANRKLRDWERDPKFRDMIYASSVVELDLDTPEILMGLAKKAKRGRVDAARLALEITGRHNPKGDQAPTQVVIAVNGIPRPVTTRGPEFEVEGEVVGEE